jgi:hypothetical protein
MPHGEKKPLQKKNVLQRFRVSIILLITYCLPSMLEAPEVLVVSAALPVWLALLLASLAWQEVPCLQHTLSSPRL